MLFISYHQIYSVFLWLFIPYFCGVLFDILAVKVASVR